MKTHKARSLLAAIGIAAGIIGAGSADAADKVVRIAHQKLGTLALLKSTGALEDKLKALGYKVTWTEFPAGPQLLEGLNVGAVDFGHTGEAPPIFAQAANAALLYVGHEPRSPASEAILVPGNSAIQSVADLKGKRVALNKGSNVHYLLVQALQQAGLKYGDITPVFLTPADARAAFVSGSIHAWVIWEPFRAAAEATAGARTLKDGAGLVANHEFYLASRKFATENPEVIATILSAVGDEGQRANRDIPAVAAQFSRSVGIPAPILETALKRTSFGAKPITPEVVAEQQKIADTFFSLGLIPKAIKISDAVQPVPGSGTK
ncbi:sulfonate ABC transporter substrate-binding protein [Chelatococcus reniformis]|uniref:Putative aliphatic sulfonates-binding protein n=1 Tax=Chelatococcus reniformis TaxID=1494448 RepID=A0A916TYY8_9HYPH|nr:sulfonate ABC transporter substrate-binding protein [Chelatococcus reniformis]GGC53188.1 sulfonate ABC transporter substrate-binding protein [Chelatococcus reniformis]